MSKLPEAHKFLDLSDYGRPIARAIANALKNTSVTPVQVTIWFIISGGIAVVAMYHQYFWLAGFFLILKSILDAADGELARVKNTPSYTGRYLDSLADFILNLCILITIGLITSTQWHWVLLAFIGLQLQGTLYNYYYVILRNLHEGDTTSRVVEKGIPKALPGEKQRNVTILYRLYAFCYGFFDTIIYSLDPTASKHKNFPKFLMTGLSTFGLGFQLLLISILLVLGLKEFIIPFFIGYSVMILIFIGIRKFM